MVSVDDAYHPVGACLFYVDGASKAEVSSASNLVVEDVADSFDMDGPAIFNVRGMSRDRLGKLKGFIGDRMEARSFWYGLGHRSVIRLVVRSLSPEEAETQEEKERAMGIKAADSNTKVIIIVEAQCGVFDIQEFKNAERVFRDQRPGRALNALLRYCESGLPAPCQPFYDAKALKVLTKRTFSLKDIGDSIGVVGAKEKAATRKRTAAWASGAKKKSGTRKRTAASASGSTRKRPKRNNYRNTQTQTERKKRVIGVIGGGDVRAAVGYNSYNSKY